MYPKVLNVIQVETPVFGINGARGKSLQVLAVWALFPLESTTSESRENDFLMSERRAEQAVSGNLRWHETCLRSGSWPNPDIMPNSNTFAELVQLTL